MLNWSETTVFYRVLIVVTFGFFAYVIFVAPEDFKYDWIAVMLFAIAFVYHFLQISRLQKDRPRKRAKAEHIEPRLKWAPTYSSSKDLPDCDEFEVIDIDTGRSLGKLGKAELKELIRAHEEWGLESNDFFVLEETVQVLRESGASEQLINFLYDALSGRHSMEIRWVE